MKEFTNESSYKNYYSTLIQLFPMHPFSNPWKHQKTLWFSDVFRVMRKGALETNGLKKRVTINCHNFEHINHSFCSRCQISNQDELIFALVMVFQPFNAWCQLKGHTYWKLDTPLLGKLFLFFSMKALSALKMFFISYWKLFLFLRFLPISWWRPLSYRNQSIDLQSKSMDWFLYDNGLRHERVKFYPGFFI